MSQTSSKALYGFKTDVTIDRLAERIKPLHREGKTIVEICETLGLKRYRVESVMKARGMTPLKQKDRPLAPSRAWYREAMLRHRQGKKPSVIIAELKELGFDVKPNTLTGYFSRVRDGLAVDPLEGESV